MKSSKRKTPNLRFSEFTNEYVESNLKTVVEYVKGFPFKSETYKSYGCRIIRVSDLNARDIKLNNDKICFDERSAGLYKKYKINKGDIIITTVGSKPHLIESAVGRGIYVDKNEYGYLNQNLLKFNNNDRVVNKFLFGYINSDRYASFIKVIQRGNANQSNITMADLLEYPIYLTSHLEQQKIADFLTAVDTKIQQLTHKKALLEKYKKGVSRQIFSQEIRFKDDDGKDFPEWEEKKLGNIGEIIGGGTPDTSISEYWEGDIYWFTPTEIKFKYLDKSLRTITAKGLKFSSAKTLPKGTLLLSSRATVGDVGIALNECTTNQGFQSIIVNNENENEFIYYWLIQNRKKLLRKASGSTFLEINKTEISKLKIFVPIKAEQLKASSFLKAIDVNIFHIAQQLQQTQTFKKGLLQKMFI